MPLQPSHDWSASNPNLDFHTNAVGTLNMLECVRKYSQSSTLVYLSTNKVYGDLVNTFEYKELNSRYEVKRKIIKKVLMKILTLITQSIVLWCF